MVELLANSGDPICRVLSKSALFANYPFRGLQPKMGYTNFGFSFHKNCPNMRAR